MYRKVIFSLTTFCLILLTVIAWKVEVSQTIAGMPCFLFIKAIVTNSYFGSIYVALSLLLFISGKYGTVREN